MNGLITDRAGVERFIGFIGRVLVCVCTALGLIPSNAYLAIVAQTCNSSAQDIEAGEPSTQGHQRLAISQCQDFTV